MKISVGDLRELIRSTLVTESKKNTQSEKKHGKGSIPDADLSVLTIGDLGMIIKRGYQSPDDKAIKYIDALIRIKDMNGVYNGKPIRDIVDGAVKAISGWTGEMATKVKAELKSRLDSTL